MRQGRGPDLSRQPSSRYRVVERGRRLVVLDTHNGNAPVTRAPPGRIDSPRPTELAPDRPESAASDLDKAALALRAGAGQPILKTRSWFDDKAPRRILLHNRKQGRVGLLIAVVLIFAMTLFALIGWPVAIVIGWLIFHRGARKAIRRAITAWLDDAGQEIASDASAG